MFIVWSAGRSGALTPAPALTATDLGDQVLANSSIPERGAYAIQCSDGRAYVGSSVDIKRRWKLHRWKLRTGRHENRGLQKAWLEMGELAFALVVIECVPVGDLFEAEQRAMDTLRAVEDGFNIAPFAGSSRGVAPSEQARANMSKAQKVRVFSPTHRARLSASKRGEGHHLAKITADDVREIRRRYALGEKRDALGAAYGISGQAASLIARRKRWASVD
jgi:group I intron endonuclease